MCCYTDGTGFESYFGQILKRTKTYETVTSLEKMTNHSLSYAHSKIFQLSLSEMALNYRYFLPE